MRHKLEQGMRQEARNINKLHTSYGKLQTMLSCCATNGSRCKSGLFQVADFGGNWIDSKSSTGCVLCMFRSSTLVPTSWVFKKTDSGSHSSTEGEFFSPTHWRMRTPIRHSLLVFQSAIVGTAHSGIGVFVMTEAERKRHDARILAHGRRLLQGQAKVETHDGAHVNFAS